MILKPGDEIMFGWKKYTLIEQTFVAPRSMWLAVETERADATPRLLVESDMRPCAS